MTPDLTTDLTIDRLVSAAARAANLEDAQARAALTGALGLLDRHASVDSRDALYSAIPGAAALARSDAARPRGGGLFGGLMKSAGGVSGAAISEAMGLLNQLKKVGVDKADLKRLLPAAREEVRVATGRDLLGDAVRSMPGVGAMLGDD